MPNNAQACPKILPVFALDRVGWTIDSSTSPMVHRHKRVEMQVNLKAISDMAAYSDYAIVGRVDAETGRVEMLAEPLSPKAATYTLSGTIVRTTGEIAIVAMPNDPGATSYTITGSFDPQAGKLFYVRAKPGSFHRPKFSLSGSIDLATGQVDLTAESQLSTHPNYHISNTTD
jgi:hypothetical protein